MRDISTLGELRALWTEIKKTFERNPFLAFEFIENPEATLLTLGYRLAAPARAALLQSLPA